MLTFFWFEASIVFVLRFYMIICRVLFSIHSI